MTPPTPPPKLPSKAEFQTVRIKITLTAKILGALVAIVLFSIAFLGFSASRIFVYDKETSVFTNQVTESTFAGRELTGRLKSSMDLLRTVLSQPQLSEEILQNILVNQQELDAVELFGMEGDSRLRATRSDDVEPITGRWNLESVKESLTRRPYALRDVTVNPARPRIAVFMTAGVPPVLIVSGTIPIGNFVEGLQSSGNHFVVLNEDGSRLMDSDVARSLSGESMADDPVFAYSKSNELTLGSKKIEGKDGKAFLGTYFKTDLGPTVLARADYKKVIQSVYSLVERIVIFGLLLLSVMAIIGALLIRKLTAPLRHLFRATDEIGAGNFDVKIQISTSDEIAALANAFTFMTAKIKKLISDMVEKGRLDQELKIANEVQQRLLPKTSIVTKSSRISSFYRSATECGGDWWGHMEFPGRSVFAIADATGHGVSAALITASARSAFSVFEKFTTEGGGVIEPDKILEVANRAIFDSAQGDIMMTFFCAVVDHEAKKVHYCSAGHNPQYLMNLSGGKMELKTLLTAGVRLGEKRNIEPGSLVPASLDYQAGDRLIMYTDGLTDGTNVQRKAYGKKAFRKSLTDGNRRDVQGTVNHLATEFINFVGPKALDDDVTIVVSELT